MEELVQEGCALLPSSDTFSKDLARNDGIASWSAKGIPPFRR